MKPTPILFLGDAPDQVGGLSRILRDLAVQTCSLPQFRVGSFGRGGRGSSQLPFAQYVFPDSAQWGEEYIEECWSDFAKGERGIIFSIWDITRLTWFARPRMGGRLQHFLNGKHFERWGYFPIDSSGVGGKLTGMACDAFQGFDRVLAYTIYGKQVIEASTGRECDWLPHGFNGKVFTPRGQEAGRAMIGVNSTDKLVGCVMTNQARKDWGAAFVTMARVKEHFPNVKLWAHTDTLERVWNMRALAADFGLNATTFITLSDQFSSEQLSYLYSACDVTMLPSLGEGHGFPLIESMACGVPAIHTNHAGGAEFIPFKELLIDPLTFRLEGPWNCLRPVLDPEGFANATIHALRNMPPRLYGEECTRAVSHLEWANLWHPWKAWLLKGLEGFER